MSGEQFTATAEEVKEFKACVRRNEKSEESLLRCFLEAGMEVIVAPAEADGQIAFLAGQKRFNVAAILTGDSGQVDCHAIHGVH